jgi:hypothetical protein
MYMSDILKRPGWNHVIEEKAGRPYSKRLNSAISQLVDRRSLGSNPAQKIQRIANALHKHYADKAFSKPDIIEFIKNQIPSIKLQSEIDPSDFENTVYTADNQWNSRYVDEEEVPSNDTELTYEITPEQENQVPVAVAQENVKLSPKAQDRLLREQYYKRIHNRFRQEERYM